MLPKKNRMQKNDFSKDFFLKKRFCGTHIILFVQDNNTSPRFAFVVGSGVSKKANIRNTLKRRARTVLRHTLNKLRINHKGVFVFKKGSELYSYDELEQQIQALLERAGFFVTKKTTLPHNNTLSVNKIKK